ncbi:hypothetical protein GH714_042201 [Hevea brasiliensis]|uniref:ATP-dependent DNA helicase n=1 Tax=Hevea brasiliensis TaxID=3981 RepID=A0A6A6MTG8_HEVBR|nr:hypothetical protein GH714_042201 [Hevea brasiliensis]
MAGSRLSSEEVIAKLIEMGFENSSAVQAVKKVGPLFNDAVEYILNGSCGDCGGAPSNSEYSTSNRKALGKRTLSSAALGQMRQSSILNHFQYTGTPKRSRNNNVPDISISSSEILARPIDDVKASITRVDCGNLKTVPEDLQVCFREEADTGLDWEQRANNLLQKHFGYSSVKSFQKEALAAWLAHQDCLVLAATGSGKSLCFQIPALLTGKVVIVISPLISLMHDQCLKLSRYGISACFLGSGQPDSGVEQKAMRGMYDIIYVCPETVLRLIKPLQGLAESRGIALFAIDEVHCVSKWGHDFRPDYRRLSVLRENFNARNLQFLKFDIPLMALTATATIQVREDILESLNMSKETKIVITSFFRPNLRFLVTLSPAFHSCSFAYGEFCGESPHKDWEMSGLAETIDASSTAEKRLALLQEPLEEGPTIIYVPTRKETLSIANYLCDYGVKAAAYNASLSKSHLRQVHKEFHDNMLEVVVATVAFGMGIDKLNVRRIIHYGWPQSLEAYYQEAGRAGRDGKLAECILYANLSRIPSLLPSKRSEDQTKQAYKMLSDCFRYGMNTSCCRAKILVEYFGEDFSYEKCLLCDVCVDGPPKVENLKEEADILMQIIAAHHGQSCYLDGSYDDTYSDSKSPRLMQKPNLRMFVSKLREQSQKFCEKDQLWWRGLARVIEGKGYIREGDDKIHVQIKFPQMTRLGLEFLEFERDQPFYVYPEADMILSMNKCKSYSTFADWGKGWADPEIRHQRLEKRRLNREPRKPRMRKSRKGKPDTRTARGRITAKLSKLK